MRGNNDPRSCGAPCVEKAGEADCAKSRAGPHEAGLSFVFLPGGLLSLLLFGLPLTHWVFGAAVGRSDDL